MSRVGSRGPSRLICPMARRKRLVEDAAGRRHEDRPFEAVGIEVGELADDRAAHRVADEGHPLDAAIVEEPAPRRARGRARRGAPVALPLRPNPGRSGTSVWKSSASRSAVGRRYRPDRPKPCTCIITGASGGFWRLAVEHVDAVDRRPPLGERRGRPRAAARGPAVRTGRGRGARRHHRLPSVSRRGARTVGPTHAPMLLRNACSPITPEQGSWGGAVAAAISWMRPAGRRCGAG